jgi:polyisoprenoid-binding protein YceI
MESKVVGGSLELDPKVQIDPAQLAVAGLDGGKLPIKAKVSIPIRSLKSHAVAMDNVCQDAMESAKYPRIEYQVMVVTAKNAERKPGTPFEFNSVGNLVIHGVTNKITMPVTIARVDEHNLRVKGTAPLKMTAFGVKPPSPSVSLGLIKTGDDVKVSFDWLVVKKAEPTTTAAK